MKKYDFWKKIWLLSKYDVHSTFITIAYLSKTVIFFLFLFN